MMLNQRKSPKKSQAAQADKNSFILSFGHIAHGQAVMTCGKIQGNQSSPKGGRLHFPAVQDNRPSLLIGNGQDESAILRKLYLAAHMGTVIGYIGQMLLAQAGKCLF